jgi:hypothetical protein
MRPRPSSCPPSKWFEISPLSPGPGIRIHREGDDPVEISGGELGVTARTRGLPLGTFGFTQLGLVIKTAAHTLAQDYPIRKSGPWVSTWLERLIARRIGADVRSAWADVTSRAHPDAIAVHRAVFAACGPGDDRWPSVLFSPALYRRRFAVRDITAHRAAAAAAGTIDILARDGLHERALASLPGPAAAADAAAPLIAAPREAIARAFASAAEQLDPSLGDEADATLLEDWMALFSPPSDSRPSRSLRRTLMNLPGGVPARLLAWLRRAPIDRPFTDRLELLALLATAACADDRQLPAALAAASRSTRKDVERMLRTVSRALRRPLDPRRASSVIEAVRFTLDRPDVSPSATLSGLAKRSAEWHRDITPATGLDPSTPTARPPIPLPASPHIRFLATVRDIIMEAAAMHHCAASYAEKAARGECYLFHVSRNGEEATVEVLPTGEVAQARGPCNSINSACRWARSALARWARALP